MRRHCVRRGRSATGGGVHMGQQHGTAAQPVGVARGAAGGVGAAGGAGARSRPVPCCAGAWRSGPRQAAPGPRCQKTERPPRAAGWRRPRGTSCARPRTRPLASCAQGTAPPRARSAAVSAAPSPSPPPSSPPLSAGTILTLDVHSSTSPISEGELVPGGRGGRGGRGRGRGRRVARGAGAGAGGRRAVGGAGGRHDLAPARAPRPRPRPRPRPAPPAAACAQLYSTEPGKKHAKTLTPPHGAYARCPLPVTLCEREARRFILYPVLCAGDLDEISPYATFSMGGACAGAGAGAAAGAGAGAGRGCSLRLHSFGRASPPAPPARPNLLHNAPVSRSIVADILCSNDVHECTWCAFVESFSPKTLGERREASIISGSIERVCNFREEFVTSPPPHRAPAEVVLAACPLKSRRPSDSDRVPPRPRCSAA
ncbi:hypothetical protein MSG28_011325 [Choristoneura fumiferana]|uniref:Uncharacterized protein n=1 Tax=Choristoneura fumiferana TaxID=7141 RepID=A0ACC0KRU0_CHOFU|nr:hypothetical protein MSG28_011325 [Choristoneura fumiferana]